MIPFFVLLFYSILAHLASSFFCGCSRAGSNRGSSIVLALPDAADPGCRALVPYTTSPPARGPVVSLRAPPSLLALPASPASGDLSPSSSCRTSPGGAWAGEAVAHRLDIPLEVFPIVFQVRGIVSVVCLALSFLDVRMVSLAAVFEREIGASGVESTPSLVGTYCCSLRHVECFFV